jgi:hypothetical protein
MPDQYLYHNGQAMALDGTASNSKEPVIKGNFQTFSGVPDVLQQGWDNPYGDCSATSGQNGNPWTISTLPKSAGTNAHFCLDATLPSDPEHSS